MGFVGFRRVVRSNKEYLTGRGRTQARTGRNKAEQWCGAKRSRVWEGEGGIGGGGGGWTMGWVRLEAVGWESRWEGKRKGDSWDAKTPHKRGGARKQLVVPSQQPPTR